MISDLFHTTQERHLAMQLSRSLRGYDADRDELILQAALEAIKEASGQPAERNEP
jgi:hypothetical protein